MRLPTEKKHIAVVGDAMIDEWVVGEETTCQDGCPAFRVKRTFRTPGGAGNAARQLKNWPVVVSLFIVADRDLRLVLDDHDLSASQDHGCHATPVKTRYVSEANRIFYRADTEIHLGGLSDWCIVGIQNRIVNALAETSFDAIYLSDYDKGLFDDNMISRIAQIGRRRDKPVIIDPKRHPDCCPPDVLIKCNDSYLSRYPEVMDHPGGAVVTYGAARPQVLEQRDAELPISRRVDCVNHVGAGDCFGVHLALALAHGVELPKAARFAHAAGRAYVQKCFSTPPTPEEVYRDLDG